VLVRRSGELLPYVALFASRDIAPGEELTFSYGGESCAGDQAQEAGQGRSRRRCLCGTPQCSGWMPSERV
jgi:SET domain-containing protein